MIRINLLPSRTGRRRRSSGKRFIAITAALALLEIGGLTLWGQTLELDAERAIQRANAAETEMKRLQDRKKELEGEEEKKNELVRQNLFFEQKKYEKTGPYEVLKFIAYTLTRKEDNLYNRDEIKAQEAAGWSPGWDADQVWIDRLEESAIEPPLKAYLIKGYARSHEDVAEFYRRLESGVYFVAVAPQSQEVKRDKDFADLELVYFTATAYVYFAQDGVLKMNPADVPNALRTALDLPFTINLPDTGGH